MSKITNEQVLESYTRLNSFNKVAAELRVDATTVRRRYNKMIARGEVQVTGSLVPEGYNVEKETIHEKDGKVFQRWIKTSADKERQAALIESVVNAMKDSIKPMTKVKKFSSGSSDLATLYTFSDYHLGMLAWKEENKESDWDLSIAKNMLVNSYSYMIESGPDAKKGIVCLLGDFLHFDKLEPVTNGHGHVLDAAVRFPLLVRTAVEVIIELIKMALQKHEEVELLICQGNHDENTAIILQTCFNLLLSDNKRLKVENSPLPYYSVEHGDTSLFFHHGHKRGMPMLQMVFASQFPKVWGNTVYRYAHTGHHHHHVSKEESGMIVEKHQTLSARDAYASTGGFFSQRGANCITYHKKFGEVSRLNVRPEMF